MLLLVLTLKARAIQTSQQALPVCQLFIGAISIPEDADYLRACGGHEPPGGTAESHFQHQVS